MPASNDFTPKTDDMTDAPDEFSKETGSGVAAAANLLESISARDRRALAIRFLRSDETMASLLRRCRGESAEAHQAKLTMACVLLMAREDAPEDLVMTDPGLYAILRQRITDIRMGGWVA